MSPPPDAAARDRSGRGAAACRRRAGGTRVIDCLLTRHTGLPRDHMGHRLSRSGRALIIEAAARVYGLDLTGRDLATDEHRRWLLPEHGRHASVAHCADFSAVAFSTGPRVGVDLQDERDRPGAMRWLGTLLGQPRPASIRDFAECEALIKASHLTKETFAGVRLPPWRPDWRPTNVGPYQVRSAALGRGMHLALAADEAAPVRWWRQPDRTADAVRTETLTLETA
ncbi:hypothetical protein [Nocardiopsis rhodophaea]